MSSSTPQARVLVRASDLTGFRQALVGLAQAGDPIAIRRRVIIVPTRAAAELLRQTIESQVLAQAGAALVMPDVCTREDWVVRLREALPAAPPLVDRTSRELLLAHPQHEPLEHPRA